MSDDFERYLRQGQRLKDESLPTEEILRSLRSTGASITDSMRVLTRIEGISLGDAKRIVHFSETWADFKDSSEELHGRAEKAARDLEAETTRFGGLPSDTESG